MKPRAAKIILVAFAWVLLVIGPGEWHVAAQINPHGQIVGTVMDKKGAVMPGAEVTSEDEATGAKQSAVAGPEGNFGLVALQPGDYRVTVAMKGFRTAVHSGVKVDAGRTTNLVVSLDVGGVEEHIQVQADAEPLEITSTEINTTVRAASVERLPLLGRTVLDFTLLTAGAQFGGAVRQSTFLGLPKASLNITFDGINNNANRFKSGDAGFVTFAAPRLGAVEEVTTSTSGLEADAAGEGAMQIKFVTKRGTNDFHGSIFWQHRNDALNANSWINNATGVRKSVLRLNEFGGNIGGPIWRNKAFFFVNYEEIRSPSSVPRETPVLNSQAQSGVFRYLGTDGVERTANLLQIAGSNGFPSVVDATTAAMFQQINGSLSQGRISSLDRNRDLLRWEAGQVPITRYPTLRLDYQISDKIRWHGVVNLTWNKILPDVFQGTDPAYPGFEDAGSTKTTRYVAMMGLDWTLTPLMHNEFSFGRQSNAESFFTEFGAETFPGRRILWPINLVSPHARTARPADPRPLPTFRNNPVWVLYDNLSLTRGTHMLTLGGSFSNVSMYETLVDATTGGGGIPVVTLGIDAADPVAAVLSANNLPAISNADLSTARGLYALATGRILSVFTGRAVNEETKQYSDGPLTRREKQNAFGFFFQDSWRARKDLTMNFGLRWEFQGANVNTNNIYTSPTFQDLWGVSGVDNLFRPGTLSGVANPQIHQRSQAYFRDYINPAPNIGVAWNPEFQSGFLKRLFGDRGTVFRGHYSLTYFREGMTTVQVHSGGNPGLTQSRSLVPGTPGFPGFFAAGSLSLASPLPPFAEDPASFNPPFNTAPFTFRNFSLATIDPNIRAPYVQNWGFGIQRQLKGSVLEIRYLGNHGDNLWRGFNLNEVNIFENGFLPEFQNAQRNLAANRAGGVTSFENRGLAGQVPLPIFQAAFGPRGSQPALNAAQGFSNGTFIQFLDQGQAGALANALSSSSTSLYLCRMVGSTFQPCASLGFNAAGPFPANFFQVNPHVANAFLLTDNSYSNYNGLQVELRRSFARGLIVNANYTWSHSITDRFTDSFIARRNYITLRDLKLDKAPSPWDIRHVFTAYWSYDLPMGRGHRLGTNNAVVNHIIGGWNFAGILRMQSGRVFQLVSGRRTVNNSDSGVVLRGITADDLQSSITSQPSGTNVLFFSPNLIGSDGRSNREVLDFPTTPGQFGSFTYIYGPSLIVPDLAIGRTFKIREGTQLEFRADFFNAFNHQTWLVGSQFWAGDPSTVSIDSTFFGRTTTTATSPRNIQFRLRLSF